MTAAQRAAAPEPGHAAADRVIEEPPVLDLDTLVPDHTTLTSEDRTLVADVVEVLDNIDYYVETDNDYSAACRAPGVAATLRGILTPHRARSGHCAACPPTTPWPCPLWRTAHRWMIELEPATGRVYEWDYVVHNPPVP